MKRALVLLGFVVGALGCGEIKEPPPPPPPPPAAAAAPNAAIVAGAGVVRGGTITMVVQLGQPFAQRNAKGPTTSIEPLGPVNQ